MEFSVFFRFWLFLRMVFPYLCRRSSVFFRIWFSVFVKRTSGFSDLVSDVIISGFSQGGLSYLGSGFSSISAPALILNSGEKQKLYWSASSLQSHKKEYLYFMLSI